MVLALAREVSILECSLVELSVGVGKSAEAVPLTLFKLAMVVCAICVEFIPFAI